VIGTATTEKPVAAPEYPTREPRYTHGLQTNRTVVTPEQGLRDLLGLSCDVPLAQVFEDASAEIRAIRDGEPEVEMPVAVVVPKRRGRPPGSRNRAQTNA